MKQTVRYKITHNTSYQYSSPVSVCHNVVILAPQATQYMQVNDHRLSIRPNPEMRDRRRDSFGNWIDRFSLEEHHSQLSISSVSHVTVLPRTIPSFDESPTCGNVRTGLKQRTDPRWLDVAVYSFDSPRIQRSPEFAGFAAAVMPENQPILLAMKALTHLIHTEFEYDKNATDVDTPTDTAFASRRGVCQDFAHVAVTCLRSLRIPARYVSGYLRTIPADGKERLVGADQSHAWVSAWCGSTLGWVEFDPTNDCICGTDHIPIAYGRDYGDVVPIKGMFLGGGEPLMSVGVDVAPLGKPVGT
jgi:transglutaminase-like putative cysteine protease